MLSPSIYFYHGKSKIRGTDKKSKYPSLNLNKIFTKPLSIKSFVYCKIIVIK
ncbi:hypothetical protein H1P_930028 [Hyella patelloides LEGE 07179]|uniref:Uncharacterized protein n=1 Tax=Hyella patelloides LEGE 07179 TaxID=945734 RepID=A0A563W5A4_9CYAN|nr:hypothetical protein H1P_930028 [Hyella patelloides LEGE 07179]